MPTAHWEPRLPVPAPAVSKILTGVNHRPALTPASVCRPSLPTPPPWPITAIYILSAGGPVPSPSRRSITPSLMPTAHWEPRLPVPAPAVFREPTGANHLLPPTLASVY